MKFRLEGVGLALQEFLQSSVVIVEFRLVVAFELKIGKPFGGFSQRFS